jgi:hypothetical protein
MMLQLADGLLTITEITSKNTRKYWVTSTVGSVIG